MSTPSADRHALDEHDAIAAVDAPPEGLTADDARARLARFGPNRLPTSAGPSAMQLLFDQMRTPTRSPCATSSRSPGSTSSAADVRLLDAAALRAQEAALTGESEPVDKAVAAVAADAPLGERRSVLYAGTVVAAGSGRGVTVATGTATELGQISTLLDAVEPLETPLTRDLAHFGRVITAAIGVAAVVLAVVAVLRGFTFADAALAGISLAVAAVPEGLPAVVTIALAVSVRRMARRQAIIRHLPAVETLGATTVVASDKTGTLTQNRTRVEALWTPDGDERELRGRRAVQRRAARARRSHGDRVARRGAT